MFVLTDFGTVDEFAGVLRAVVVREAPGCPVIDLTHAIVPFDVRAGALALERSVPHLGSGVILAVVDPGVGTRRRAVAVSVSAASGPGFLVGPDNGLLSFAFDVLGGATCAVELPSNPFPGSGGTFDGRDVFAPAAARLWSGAQLEDLGEKIDLEGLVQLERPLLRVQHGRLDAEVLWVDHFGNVQLAAGPSDALASGLGGNGGVILEVRNRTFAVTTASSFLADGADSLDDPDGDASDIKIMTDSNGHLALVCARDSAATVLGVTSRDVVVLRDADANEDDR